ARFTRERSSTTRRSTKATRAGRSSTLGAASSESTPPSSSTAPSASASHGRSPWRNTCSARRAGAVVGSPPPVRDIVRPAARDASSLLDRPAARPLGQVVPLPYPLHLPRPPAVVLRRGRRPTRAPPRW